MSTTGPDGTGPAATAVPPAAQAAEVVRVVDGDTLILRGHGSGPLREAPTRVRVIGLDTPEIGERRQCFGDQAAARARALLPARSPVRVLRDTEGTDRYGRALLHVWSPAGTLLSQQLVAEGYARVLHVRPNDGYVELLRAAQASAQRDRRGLWAACPARPDLPAGAR